MKDPDDLHIRAYKIRLTEADADFLEALAIYVGMTPAVLLRSLVKRVLGRTLYTLPTLPVAKDKRRVA